MKSIIALLAYASFVADVQDPNPPLIVVTTEDATTKFEVTLSIGHSIPSINPEWVHSISVLNESADTEKYGVRGAGGVIIITINNEHGAEIPTSMERILDASGRPGIVYALQNQRGTAEFTMSNDKDFGLANLQTAWIDSIDVIKDESARQKYGDATITGAVIFRISNRYINELPVAVRTRLSE